PLRPDWQAHWRHPAQESWKPSSRPVPGMVAVVGLAYWPLLLWVPILVVQTLAVFYMGRGLQGAVRSITSILFDTPISKFLSILWVVMLVLGLDCARSIFTAPAQQVSGVPTFEAYAAKEGFLVLLVNLVIIPAIAVVHTLNGEVIKAERDREMIKKQAEQQSQFTKNLLASEDKKATSGVPAESSMPAAKAPEEAARERGAAGKAAGDGKAD
ncbi:unnamed protein product, partial [Prorocentrum cordatum]